MSKNGIGRMLRVAGALGAIALAGFLLSRVLGQYSLTEIREAVASVAPQRIALAVVFAAGSYFCLTCFDVLGLRYAGKPLPYWQAALTSFTALSLGHNIGLAALSSGAIRFRFYSRFGLTAEQVAKVILFCAITVGLGLITLAGLALAIRSDLGETILHLPHWFAGALGFLLLAVPLLYVGLSMLGRARKLRVAAWSFEWPAPTLALAQLLIGPVNFACVAGCLYQALLAVRDVTYPDVVLVYAVANAATILSHAPGGIGVIEWVVLTLLPGSLVVGALVVFRCVYYFLPLCLGAIALASSELLLRSAKRWGERKEQHTQRVPPLRR